MPDGNLPLKTLRWWSTCGTRAVDVKRIHFENLVMYRVLGDTKDFDGDLSDSLA